jgi:hypothetical protein
VDGVLETVHAGDLALTALVGAPDHGNLVVLADRDGADLFAFLSDLFIPLSNLPDFVISNLTFVL